MKRIVIGLLILINSKSNAQITYEHTYPGPGSVTQSRPLQMINMGNNDFKYAYVDYSTNELKLFNLNHTPYITISLPIPLINSGEYVVAYVTKSLFDCDTTMFEYAIMPQSNSSNNFYVYRQDGTLLFERDSTLAPYCFGCFSGSYDIRPIINSPSGAKLFLLKADTTGNLLTEDVYSLCGTLPDDAIEMDALSSTFVKVYPNPTTEEINFEFDFPSNIQDYELVIYNSSVQVVKIIEIYGATKKYNLENSGLSSGLYFFTLKTEKKILQTGKFVKNKH